MLWFHSCSIAVLLFQCQLIVAHLKQTDAEDWFALGQEFQEMNNIEQALFCYDRGRHYTLHLFVTHLACGFIIFQNFTY